MGARGGDSRELMSGGEVSAAVERMAGEILTANRAPSLAVVGIHTGGVRFARLLVEYITRRGAAPAATGAVDITLYRDDLEQIGPAPIVHATDIDFDVSGMTVLLVDDVVFTGRTVRAAIDNLMDLGRPQRIQFAALVDRGGRELPLQPDYIGKRVEVGEDEIVEVVFKSDGACVVAYRRPAGRR